jgi:hypothetical protein
MVAVGGVTKPGELDREVQKAELLGDPLAPLLRALVTFSTRVQLDEETIRRLGYEASAGAQQASRALARAAAWEAVARLWLVGLGLLAAGFLAGVGATLWMTFRIMH